MKVDFVLGEVLLVNHWPKTKRTGDVVALDCKIWGPLDGRNRLALSQGVEVLRVNWWPVGFSISVLYFVIILETVSLRFQPVLFKQVYCIVVHQSKVDVKFTKF